MTQIYTPKSYDNIDRNIIFLAGPITKGGDWQYEAARYLHARMPNISIAMPRRRLPDDLAQYAVVGRYVTERQLEWEQKMLEIAATKGVIMFWLPKEKDFPIVMNGYTGFARDTRIELGIWMTEAKHRRETVRLVIGGEEGFSGIDVVRRNVMNALQLRELQFPDTLNATCDAAIRIMSER